MTPFLFIQIYTIYIEKILKGDIQYFGVTSFCLLLVDLYFLND